MTQASFAQEQTCVYVALGSNLGDPAQQLRDAVAALKKLPNTSVVRCSPLYETEPMGPQDQPNFVNAVCELDTSLAPHDLLLQLQAIEVEQGRKPQNLRWGARLIDLDILTFGEQQIDSIDLTIPHPGIADRSFVLYPLADLAPELQIPGVGKVIALRQHCQDFAIKQIKLAL